MWDNYGVPMGNYHTEGTTGFSLPKLQRQQSCHYFNTMAAIKYLVLLEKTMALITEQNMRNLFSLFSMKAV